MRKVSSLVASVLVSSATLFAAQAEAGYVDNVTITEIAVGVGATNSSYAATLVRTSQPSPFNCSSSGLALLTNEGNLNYKEMVAAVIAAKATGSKVFLGWSGCGGSGGNYAKINEVQVK